MKKIDVRNSKVVETLFKRDRFYVRVKYGSTIRQMPRANYNWLKSNPSFEWIPKGYVIHHLDNDQTNDDPTNLVIMQKHLHSAHHWKNKVVKTEITIHNEREIMPISRPGIIHDKKQSRHYLQFFERINGARKRRRIFSFKNLSGFKSREDAELVRYEIWDKFQNNKDCVSPHGSKAQHE